MSDKSLTFTTDFDSLSFNIHNEKALWRAMSPKDVAAGRDPTTVLQDVCRNLMIEYDPDFLRFYQDYLRPYDITILFLTHMI